MKTLYLLTIDSDPEGPAQADGRIAQILMDNPPPDDLTTSQMAMWLKRDTYARMTLILALRRVFSSS